MVATSPFSACLSPTADATLPASFDKRYPPFPSAGDTINRPPRPHTTTAATSTSFFPPNSTRHLWDDIRELTTDVKDGVLGLKEVWETNSGAPGGGGKSFIDDLSEFVEPHFESLGIVDPPHTTGNAKIGRSSSGEGKDNAKFFTFDKMERLLNYCVPLAVDPRSPKSRVRDIAKENEEIVDDNMMSASTVGSQKYTEEEESVKDLESVHNAFVNPGQQNPPMQDQALQSRSGESIPGVSEGLLEHTNRLREKLMDRSRHRSVNDGAMTTPARLLEQRMDLQGRRSGSSSSEERDVAPMVDNPSVLVPGGLWSLPSEEQRYGNSLSQSFMDSRSMHSSNSEEKQRGMKNAYYCGPNNMDDVLLMRSMSDGVNDDNDGSNNYDFPNTGSDLTDVMHNNSNESRISAGVSTSFEKGSKNMKGLVLDTELDVYIRNDVDEVVVRAAAMHAMLASPRSLDSEDKYMLVDNQEGVEKNKRNATQHKLSRYSQDTREVEAAVESRDENEAVNRHFDDLISDFELNLKPDETKERKQDKLKQYQRKKKVVQRSWDSKKSHKSPRAHVDDDTASKSSHASNYSTATFLHSTTMGRKLARSNAPSSPDSVASPKESILDSARQAMSHANQVMNSTVDKHVVTETKSTRICKASKDMLAKSADTAKHDEPSTQKTKHTEQVPSPMASYKKRLMEKRARRNQRDFASKGREEDGHEQVAAEETVKSSSSRPTSKNNALDMILQIPPSQEGSNLDICESGANSFDSSVNWDALAYSISGSMSYGSDAQPATHGAKKHDAKKIEPIVSPRSKKHPVMDRIEQIKEHHDEKMAQIRMVENSEAVPMSATSTDAPDDERGEEENTPLSPNSASSECLSPKSKAALNSTVHQHIQEMKQLIAKEMSNNERHKSPASTSSRRSQFNFDSISRLSPRSPLLKSPKSPTNEELMLRNAELEQEMEEILALSPRSPLSRKGFSSPLSSPKNMDRYDNIAPSYAESPKNKDRDFMPSYLRNNGNKCILKVEIPTSPISTPRRTARSTTSSSSKSTPMLSPMGERARTRVSDLMEEVKGFLAENDRQRERIARDMDMMQALHKY